MLSTSNALGAPLLSVLIFLPAAAAALIALLPERSRSLQWAIGVMAAGTAFAISAILLASYDSSWLASGGAQFQFADPAGGPRSWLPGGVTYYVAVDGIAVVLVFLTALLGLLALAFSWSSIRARSRSFIALMLVMETGLLGVFSAMDLFLFYVFWEAVLGPMVLIIAMWGGKARVYASVKFLLYTMAGSALMLVAIVALRGAAGASSYAFTDVLGALIEHPLDDRAQLLFFGAFALAFAIKVPLFPLHTWLPDAHVEAPTAGSVLLAGVLLKMGGYGFARLGMPLFPEAAKAAVPFVFVLAVIGVWYAAWVAFAQRDVKSLVAYSSVSHMAVVMAGLFALNTQGFAGGALQMVNHGLSTGALFLLIGMLYDRAHTRDIDRFGGLWSTMPRFSALFMVVMLSSIGLPGTNGFVSEWLALLGTFRANMLVGAATTFGVVLAAVYMLWLYQRVFFGPTSETSAGLRDLSAREIAVLLPIVVLILWIGVFPATFLAPIERSSQIWVTMIQSAGALAASP